MPDERCNDLRAFAAFVNGTLADPSTDLTLGDALLLWDDEDRGEAEREQTLRAIRRDLDELAAGRVRPAREAIEELRRRHGLTRP